MKVTLDRQDWSEPRFEALRRAMGWSQAETLGVLTLFWHGTKEACIVEAPRDRLKVFLNVQPKLADVVLDVLRRVGYIVQTEEGQDMWRVDGNERAVALARARQEWGKYGIHGRKKPDAAAAVKPKKKKSPPDPEKVAAKEVAKAQTEANRCCWEAYRDAYVAKYRVEPLRDARVNSLVTQFVKRIGQAQSPDVIRFYVAHNDASYVRAMHSLNAAVRDADALYTQWQRGTPVTGQDVRMFEAEQRVRGQLERVQRGQL